jgi:S1-C subfamily serine protease
MSGARRCLREPMIGAGFDPEHPGQAVVKEVVPGSPAEQADIRPGDAIVKYDGREVTDDKQLTRLVRAGMVGETVSVEIVRGDRTITKRVVLRSRADVEQ